ncbi:MAG: tetratricopeptide repeat protein, partial [Chloroflexota bacterium]|nr:tetratricopeptide repeat protein [Chloroflexota bacterium]
MHIGLPSAQLTPEQKRRLIFRDVARFLSNAAGPLGTLLVVDDLQWAGSDALDLLESLLRSDAPLRVLGAYRSTEVPPQHPLAGLLAGLVSTGQATTLPLDPLKDDAAAQLLRDLLAGQEVAEQQVMQVVRRAEGVPLYLVSFAQALPVAGLPAWGTEVPADLAQLIRQRVVSLPEPAQELLSIAAVAGRRVLRRVLYALARQPDERMLVALDTLTASALLVEEEEHSYRFSHDLVREVVEAGLSLARRANLHGRIGATLEALFPATQQGTSDEHLDELAYHFAGSEETDKALLYLERAGDAARKRFAYAAAEGYYRELVGRLEQLQRMGESGRIGVKLGQVLTIAGRYGEALAALERAAEVCAAAGDLEGETQAVAQIGEVHFARSTPGEGILRLHRMLEARRRSDRIPVLSPGLAWMTLQLARLLWIDIRYQEGAEVAARAVALGRALGDDRLVANAEIMHATALVTLCRFMDALPILQKVLPLAESVGDGRAVGWALNTLGGIYLATGDWKNNLACRERALEVGRQYGDLQAVAYALQELGRAAFLHGRWSRAHEYFQHAEAVSRELGRSSIAPFPPLELGRLCLAEGAWERAAHYLAEAIDHAEANGDLQTLCAAHQLLAERDIRAAHPERVPPRLQPLLDRLGRQAGASPLLATLAWAYLEMGEVAESAVQVAAGLAPQLMKNGVVDRILALRVKGTILACQDRWNDAVSAFEEALDLARHSAYPYAEAQLCFAYGKALGNRGAPQQARERLE